MVYGDFWIRTTGPQYSNLILARAAARAQLQAAQRKITAVRSEGLPRLDFSSNYYKNGYPNQGLQSTSTNTSTVGLTLTIPIFDGFSYNYKVYGAKAQAEQKEAELRDTEHQVVMEVVKTYADATSAINNLQSSDKLLNATKNSLESSTRRYNRGAADITELLNTQSAYNDAQQERVRCLFDWRSAQLMLLSSSGLLGHETLMH